MIFLLIPIEIKRQKYNYIAHISSINLKKIALFRLFVRKLPTFVLNMLMRSGFPVYIRSVAVVMLFAMFHYMVGYRFIYSLGIIYAKGEAKECMVKKTNNTQKITLPASDYNSIKWTEKNKEFSFDNEMYDVVSIQKLGDNYFITVYNDNAETGWVSSLHNYEKELFQPDQTSKGTKSAEDIMSSFQKDCTPASKFKIHVYATIGLIQPLIAVQQRPLQITKYIWHPPTVC